MKTLSLPRSVRRRRVATILVLLCGFGLLAIGAAAEEVSQRDGLQQDGLLQDGLRRGSQESGEKPLEVGKMILVGGDLRGELEPCGCSPEGQRAAGKTLPITPRSGCTSLGSDG